MIVSSINDFLPLLGERLDTGYSMPAKNDKNQMIIKYLVSSIQFRSHDGKIVFNSH